MTRRSHPAIVPVFALLAGACTPQPGAVTGKTFFACPNGEGGFCTVNNAAAIDAGPDAGRDAGPPDAGFDGGFDAGPGFDCDTDAGACVICSADPTDPLPDLLYPRGGLSGVYFKQTNGSETFERVYAIGGFDPSGDTTASVEVNEFDTGNIWTPVGNGNLTPRAFFSVISNGFFGLIAFGGEDLTTGMILGDTVIFPSDVAPLPSSSWVEASPVLIQPRENHAAVQESNGGTIITCGGTALGVPLATCETLSLQNDLDGGWQAGPALNFERDGLSMALGSDGNVYAFSGSGSNTASLTSFEMLDSSGAWSCPGTCPQMNSGHVYGAAVAVGTKIYVMGGVALPADQTSNNIVEYLDLANLSAGWKEATGMLTARSYFGAVALPTGNIRVFGGHGGPDNTCTIANVEEYSPSSNMWR
jgi:hypothetical protein